MPARGQDLEVKRQRKLEEAYRGHRPTPDGARARRIAISATAPASCGGRTLPPL